MKMFRHHEVSQAYLISNIKNKPVAVVTDGEFNFMQGSGADKEEVERYCIEEGLIAKPEPAQCVGKYQHQKTADGYMIRNDRNMIVGLVQNQIFTPIGCGVNEADVRLYCTNNGLCSK